MSYGIEPGADPVVVRGTLDKQANELDELSRGLAAVQRELHPLKRKLDNHVNDHLAGQWAAHVDDPESVKMARQDIAKILALKSAPEELRGAVERLSDKAERMRKRISDLRAEVEVNRSILSALKAEIEASR